MAAKKTKAAEKAPVIAYKGFDANMQCRGYQFEVGGEYTHMGKVEKCNSGFHACENPLDVWGYYGPFDSRFAVVELSGDLSREENGDSKIAAGKIKIKAELKMPEFIATAVKWVIDQCKDAGIVDSGNYARIGSSGNSARIGSSGNSARIGSSGDYARIGSSGNSAQIGSSGNSAQIGSSGYSARIGSSGDSAQIGSSGYSARIGSSGDSARIGSSGNSAQIGSSGYSAQIGSSGYSARIGSSGDYAQIRSEGKDAVIACAGSVETVQVGPGGCIAVPYHDGKRIRFAIGYEGEGLKAGVTYRVDALGKFVEAR